MLLFLILVTHWIGDFIFQSSWMAANKSKNIIALLAHVGVYTTCLLPFGPTYALLNGGIHFFVDMWTSRMTSRLYKSGDIHNFFVVVGADQLIHQLTLIGTAAWLL